MKYKFFDNVVKQNLLGHVTTEMVITFFKFIRKTEIKN